MSLIDWNKLTITEPPVLPRELLRNTKKELMVHLEIFHGHMVRR